MIYLVGALISAVLYRLGGIGKPYNTKYRDWGCSIVVMAVIGLSTGFSWWMIPSSLLMWGALSTYWKGDLPDCRWYHWALHGLGVGISLLPYALSNGTAINVIIYSIVLSASFALWSSFINIAWIEEGGRGFFIIAFIWIMKGF